MKGSLAAMAEAVRVLVESGVHLRGNLLLTAHGLHESGTNETLESLIRRGVHGDAVIVGELGLDALPLAGMGLTIFEIRISRDGEPIHELNAPSGLPNPLAAGIRAVEILKERSRSLAEEQPPEPGPESIFIGRFSSGDYFNRVPSECVIAGSRRYGPGRRFEDIQQEFDDVAATVAAETGTGVRANVRGNGLGSFRLSADERIVQVVREAHRRVTGKEIGFTTIRTVGNASNFINSADVPAVYYGPRSGTAHSEQERVHLEDLVRVTAVLVRAAAGYLGTA